MKQRKKNEGKCAGINANRCLLTATLPFCSVIEYSVNVADDDKEKNLPFCPASSTMPFPLIVISLPLIEISLS